MPIPAEYKAEHDRVKEMKSRREGTGHQIVRAVVEGNTDHALYLAERWKEEDAECHRLWQVEEAAKRRYQVFRAARRIGIVLGDPA